MERNGRRGSERGMGGWRNTLSRARVRIGTFSVFLGMCVYMYVYMYECMNVCMYVRMYVCTSVIVRRVVGLGSCGLAAVLLW